MTYGSLDIASPGLTSSTITTIITCIITTNVCISGYALYVLDPRTQREAFRLVGFLDACNLSDERTLQTLETELGWWMDKWIYR